MARRFSITLRRLGGSESSFRSVLRSLALGAAAVTSLVACADVRSGAPPAHSTASPNGSSALEAGSNAAASASVAAPSTPHAADPPYVTALRLERWSEAQKLLAALDPSEQANPEIRYVRARVASALGDAKAVGPLLDGLALPLLDDDIARLRAEAAVEVGPFDQAARYYESRGRTRDLLLAAKAMLRSGDKKAALALADRALAQAQRMTRNGDERAAHGMRVDLLLSDHKVDEALTDLKWLAIKAPASVEGRASRKALADNKKTLTTKELVESIDALVDGGAGKEALEELDKNAKTIARPDFLRLRAEALFKSRQYAKAAEAYLVASKVQSGATAEQIYYSGRALARSKKEDEAAKRYREVVKRFRKEPWAERASFQLASLLLSGGKYAEAAEAFTDYVAKFPKGASRDDAQYGLALAYLSAGKPGKARRVFGQLAQGAKKTEVGVLRELEGVAALRDGSREDAIALFTQISKDQPLTWAALASRARLSNLGAPLPPIIEPPPVRSSSPLGLVLPLKAKKLAELGLDADAEAALAENEQAAGAAYPGRETEALCAMYGGLTRAKRRYKVGAAFVSFDALMHAPSDADRWSWECVYPAPYGDTVAGFEKENALPTGLMHSVMRQESGFDPEATSPVGALGLMQLMPTTAEQAAKETNAPFDPASIKSPETNLRLGGFYLGKLAKTFDGCLPLAVASYNAGPSAVARWVETAIDFEVDVWVARIPYEETRNYVARVMGNLARYQWLRGGDATVLALPLSVPTQSHTKDEDY